MNADIFRAVIFGVIIVGAGVTWTNIRSAQNAEVENTFLAQQNSVLASRLRDATATLTRARQANDDLHSQLHAQQSPPSAPKSSTGSGSSASRLQPMQDNPALQNLESAARRAQLMITYGPFYRSLGLSAQQIEQFETALVRRDEQYTDLFAAAQTQGTSVKDPAYQKLSKQVGSDYQAAVRELFGKTGAQYLGDYERLDIVREIVSGMAGATAMAGMTLDAQQAERLTRTLANASHSYQSGGFAAPASIDWAAVHEQARAFLSDSQLTFIETTEPRGPRGMGGRFLPLLNAAIDAASEKEISTAGAR